MKCGCKLAFYNHRLRACQKPHGHAGNHEHVLQSGDLIFWDGRSLSARLRKAKP